MSSPRQLPAETLALIFYNLAHKDLHRCLLVSRLWHAEAEPLLYSAVNFNSSHKCYRGFVAAVTARRHLLRRVAWISNVGGETAVPELLDILLDYRPDEHEDEITIRLPPTLPVVFPLGPNRPALTHLSYSGSDISWPLFDSVLYSLTSLVSLELHFFRRGRGIDAEGYHMDMGRTLATFPHLKHLSILGWITRYVPPMTTTLAEEDRGNFIHAKTQAGSGDQYRLESFTFYPSLMGRNGRDASLFFKRLGNLKRIVVLPRIWSYGVNELCRPWDLGRALKEFCPKLESIEAEGALTLWLFDLPILPHDKLAHLTALVEGHSLQDVEGMSDAQVQENRLRQRLQDQEVGELLEGKGADPFFPQLKRLILGQKYYLSAQDLISLGVQAQFLTDLEIQISPDHYEYWQIHLAQKALHQCLFVSRFWHDPAEARLYSDILIDLRQKARTDSLFQALRTRKHLLRRVEWRPYGYCRKALEANLLDILLDYPPSPPLNDSDSSTSTGHLAYSSTSLASYTVLTNAYGPNRPGLTEFTFKGVGATARLLQTILFNLTPTTLTRLNLDFDYGEFQVFTVDVERILDYFPRLKHLSITGWMHKYAPIQAPHVDTNDTMAAGATRGLDCGLETLRFASILMCREGPEAFLFLRRLGFLRKLVTGSQVSYPPGMLRSRPWAFGRALKESCPKLESIEIQGALVFWLFDLPVLLSSKVPHLKSLIEGLSSNEAGDLSSEAQEQSEDQLRLRLAEQELGELLEGKTAVPFFPQLKTLVLAVGHSLSAQDLISLGVQARFLTHLKILFQPTKERIAWNVYENDAPASVRTDVHSPVTVIDTLVENRRLQKRRPFNNRDVILFLQLCSSLTHINDRANHVYEQNNSTNNNNNNNGNNDDITCGYSTLGLRGYVGNA
ncbi:hypothetical protein BGZ97_006071 [Linnemannia gamsii]|uniref:F-box domain-containing protein n=1 Tax=Linnemannia gamsii TaxID=64522 RepID=A0A9P6RGB0_9FUNG|nr:hypothetical protein BGZ97_006071 [Linnemannia gamsii]